MYFDPLNTQYWKIFNANDEKIIDKVYTKMMNYDGFYVHTIVKMRERWVNIEILSENFMILVKKFNNELVEKDRN